MTADSTPSATLTPRAASIAARIDSAVLWFATHWLAVFMSYGALVVGLAAMAPLLKATGHPTAASVIYLPYRLICHQRADRSFHLHGEQMAFCERDVALVSGAVMTALAFALIRHRRVVSNISFAAVVVLALPMAVDGGTQLVGLRESTTELRVLTGSLFSLGVGWYVLPHLESGFMSIRDEIHGRRSGAVNGRAA